MATLGGGHRTRTLWQPLGAVTETRQIARGDLHNLIGDPDASPELYTIIIELRTPQRLGLSPQLNLRPPTTPRSFTTMEYGSEVTSTV